MMSSVYSDLPPETLISAASGMGDGDGIVRPAKRARGDGDASALGAPDATATLPAASKAASEGDPMTLALRKLADHIRQPKRFMKSSQLLRQLLEQEDFDVKYGHLVFQALCAAMEDRSTSLDPAMALEYSRLFKLASRRLEMFTAVQRAHLDVLGIWAVLRSQVLTTDDSFLFNKTLTRLRGMIDDLTPVTDDDGPSGAREDDGEPTRSGVGSVPNAEEEAGVCTPRGPDASRALPATDEPEHDDADARPSSASTHTMEDLRRQALIDAVEGAKLCYGKLWARTSVNLLIEHASKRSVCFHADQRERVDALMDFVRKQRAARKLGTSSKERDRDMTSFDRAKQEWGKATVSHRGNVGGGGDHKSEAWLG